jgi:hypothetical protein
MTLVFEPPAVWDYRQEAPMYASLTGITPAEAIADLRGLIEHGIINQPRSLQKVIGPSEVGNPCDHCLAAKLAGWQETENEVPWLPFIGTAVHAALEQMVLTYEANRNAVHTTGRRFLTEARVMVGTIGGTEIWGSTDLVDLEAGMTNDWKIVGASTLKTAKAGPSQVYRVQAHLYAKGWNDAGHTITEVGIAYLPRNAVSLSQAIWWHEPFNRDLAEKALERANQIAAKIAQLRIFGQAAVDAWITALPRHNRSFNPDIAAGKECRDCQRFPDNPNSVTGPMGLDDVL